jgi:SET and MYND domain-containing protein
MSDTADSRRAEGNAAFQLEQYHAAVEHYSAAIVLDRHDLRGWNNRAQAYLETGQPLLAWGDALHVLKMEPTNLKAALRLADAYMKMKMYDTAIGWCREAPIPSHLAQKQLERCLKARQADTPNRGNTFKVNYTPFRAAPGQARHPDVVMAALAPRLGRIATRAALRPAPSGGLGLFAQCDIPAGEMVHIEKPLLAVAVGKDRCYHCTDLLQDVATAVACGGCDRRYCCQTCHDEALELYHRLLCSAAHGQAVARLEAKADEGVSASSRNVLYMWKMLGWALTERNKAGAGAALVRPTDMLPFCHFHRRADMPLSTKPMYFSSDHIMTFWTLVRDLLPPALLSEPALSVQWIIDCSMMLIANTIGLSGNEGTLGPQALMCSASFFNHSCTPNVVDHAAKNGIILFMAKRDIVAGEELFISYVAENASREFRQQMLALQYGFACRCDKCRTEAAAE